MNLSSLLTRYRNIDDFESDVAFFRTNTPHRAPLAYLHILYKPAPATLQRQRCAQLAIPQELANFYAEHNGAELFGGTIRIFGFLPDHYLLNRNDWRNLPPLNIIDITGRYQKELDARDLVVFADYDVDASPVCCHRKSGAIHCFAERAFTRKRKTWPNFETWITTEISRLDSHFDETGRCLTSDEERLLPP